MADVDEELKVQTDDETPIVVEEEPKAKAEEPKKEPDERESALAELKAQLEQQKIAAERERIAREQAEHYAREQAQRAEAAQTDVRDSRLGMIANAIDSTEAAASAAERAYADALAAGDYQTAAKAQRAMAQAESQLLQLRNGKSALEEQLARPAEGRVEAPQYTPQPRNVDPLEDMASRLTPKSAAWLRANPSAASNVNKLTAAHTAAVELKGLEVESPAYFNYIEETLGIKPAQKAQAPASMPVSGGSSSGGRSNDGGIHLSSTEVEMAILSFPDLPRQKALEAYAKNKVALQKEGKLH